MLDLLALLASDCSAQRIVRKVTGDSDADRLDHRGFVFGEVWAVQVRCVHVHDVLVGLLVAVVVVDDLIHEGGEGVVAVVAAGIDTDTRLSVLCTRKDGLLERVACSILGILEFFVDFWGQALAKERLGASREVWSSINCLRVSKVASHQACVWLSFDHKQI